MKTTNLFIILTFISLLWGCTEFKEEHERNEIDEVIPDKEGPFMNEFHGSEQITFPNGFTVEYYEGRYFMENDIELSESTVQDLMNPETRSVWDYGVQKWVGKVNYIIEPSIPGRTAIIQAMEVWGAVSGLQFVEGVSDSYIAFIRGDMNTSYIGRQGGKQYITLDNWDNPVVIAHEIGHALGLQHEHTHPDRDNNIRIDYSNIPSNLHYAFDINPHGVSAWESGVDFNSIMMYYPYSFAIDKNKPTIIRLDGKTWSGITNYITLSDILAYRAIESGNRYFKREEADLVIGSDNFYTGCVEKYTLDIPSAENIRWSFTGLNENDYNSDGTTVSINALNAVNTTLNVTFTLPTLGSGKTYYTITRPLQGHHIIPSSNIPEQHNVNVNEILTIALEFGHHPYFVDDVWQARWHIRNARGQSVHEIVHQEKDGKIIRVKFPLPGRYYITAYVNNPVDYPVAVETDIPKMWTIDVGGEYYPDLPCFDRDQNVEAVKIGEWHDYSVLFDSYLYGGRSPDANIQISGPPNGYLINYLPGYSNRRFSIKFLGQGRYDFKVTLSDPSTGAKVEEFMHYVHVSDEVVLLDRDDTPLMEINQSAILSVSLSDYNLEDMSGIKILNVTKSNNSYYPAGGSATKIRDYYYRFTPTTPGLYTITYCLLDLGSPLDAETKQINVVQTAPVSRELYMDRPNNIEDMLIGVNYEYHFKTESSYPNSYYIAYIEGYQWYGQFDLSKTSSSTYTLKSHDQEWIDLGVDLQRGMAGGTTEVLLYRMFRINSVRSDFELIH